MAGRLPGRQLRRDVLLRHCGVGSGCEAGEGRSRGTEAPGRSGWGAVEGDDYGHLRQWWGAPLFSLSRGFGIEKATELEGYRSSPHQEAGRALTRLQKRSWHVLLQAGVRAGRG